AKTVRTWKSGDLFEVPARGKLAQLATSYLDHDVAFEPVVPKLAATVMLVRDADFSAESRYRSGNPSALEVFMLRRAKTMAFVPDAVVFPGGSVDVRDSDPGLPWAGPSPETWAQRMGCDVATARRIVVAAAREVFEECGVLLAGADGASVIEDMTDPLWDEERARLTDHVESFAEMMIRRNLVLRTDLLGVRSRWMTPEFEPRRYDTFFFSALLPKGQTPDDRTSEATVADWVDPVWLFDQAEKGTALLVPPTRYNLSFVASACRAEAFVAEAPLIERIMLQPVRSGSEEVVLRCQIP
ncbi:MAG: hypothetical protein RR505_07640, partial [Raoultibacter sp.]